ncbi:anion-transporting ATPase [Serpentinicella alkaliphila]|uniref:Anion-transporting ATPase n=1 Tax=Serpentinicella alkaliphila TaxID=1734049 RepID=A0A4V6NSC3_9FIRM|nr:anion-transporting ATPase [Serpentinicella alkaliphila]
MEIQLTSEAVEIQENLWAQEINTIHETEQGWKKVQEYITTLLMSRTIKDITTEELTTFPGIEYLLGLLRILKYYKEKIYDVIVNKECGGGLFHE